MQGERGERGPFVVGGCLCSWLTPLHPPPALPHRGCVGWAQRSGTGGFQPLPVTCAALSHFSLSFRALPSPLTVSQLGHTQGPELAPSRCPPCSAWGCWGQDGASMLAAKAYPAVPGCPNSLSGVGSSPPCQRFQLSIQAPSPHPASFGLKTKSRWPGRAEKTESLRYKV